MISKGAIDRMVYLLFALLFCSTYLFVHISAGGATTTPFLSQYKAIGFVPRKILISSASNDDIEVSCNFIIYVLLDAMKALGVQHNCSKYNDESIRVGYGRFCTFKPKESSGGGPELWFGSVKGLEPHLSTTFDPHYQGISRTNVTIIKCQTDEETPCPLNAIVHAQVVNDNNGCTRFEFNCPDYARKKTRKQLHNVVGGMSTSAIVVIQLAAFLVWENLIMKY